MARKQPPVPARKPRAKKTQKRLRKIDMPPLAMSVDQFCDLNNIHRDLFYAMLRANKAPQCMLIGKRRLISFEAAEQWRRDRERETAEAAVA
ncbi:hypothetical protein Q2941_32465 [Bradyrhizobium sp. UFLA05-153]